MKLLKSLSAWLVLVVLVSGIIGTLTADDRAKIDELSDSLLRRQELLARLENLPKREENIKAALEILDDGLAARSLYSGEPASLRTEIQRDIRDIASENNIRIGSMRPLGVRRSDAELIRSTVQLNYETTHDINLDFLKAIEAAEPLLRVQRLSVAVQSASSDTSPARLAINMEVAGFARRIEREDGS